MGTSNLGALGVGEALAAAPELSVPVSFHENQRGDAAV
jgi:hypothetical protein